MPVESLRRTDELGRERPAEGDETAPMRTTRRSLLLALGMAVLGRTVFDRSPRNALVVFGFGGEPVSSRTPADLRAVNPDERPTDGAASRFRQGYGRYGYGGVVRRNVAELRKLRLTVAREAG